MMKWRNKNYSASKMPSDFMGIGQETPCGRFFVGARYSGSYGNQLNWAVLEFRTGTVTDRFRYRRDAKAYVERYLIMERIAS